MTKDNNGFPNKKYSVVYADPPWELRYFKETNNGMKSTELPYKTMTDEQIINLPIKEIIAENAMLFIWVVESRVPILEKLMKSWGFNYRGIVFVWHKKASTTGGENALFTSYGMKSCEFCFLGVRGSYIVQDKIIKQFLSIPKRKHSEKPNEFRERIVKMCGNVLRIELFARIKPHGWDTFGNDEKLQLKPLEMFN